MTILRAYYLRHHIDQPAIRRMVREVDRERSWLWRLWWWVTD